MNDLQARLAHRRVVALTGALFLSYLTVAMSLPAVPVYVAGSLGFNNASGGLAVGIAFLSTILTRGRAGAFADRLGGKRLREPFWRGIIGRIWRPGATLGLAGIGFAALGAFYSLYVLSRGWPHPGLGLTCFGAGFVLVRLLGGNLPDRVGSTPVAVVSLAVEACGQLLLWLAPNPLVALAGALLTGAGCSLVFPAMGIQVVRRVPPHLRGTAMGGFAAFQDLANGLTGPAVGLLADSAGLPIVFLIGFVAAVLGVGLAVIPGRAVAA